MPPTITDLEQRLSGITIRDEDRLRRRLNPARKRRREPAAGDAGLAEIAGALEAAERRLERRRAGVPQPRYPDGLPVSERKDEILAAIARHPVVIVAGETGSGKSTQLPKICLEAGRGVRGLIGHTQPRRLAARAVAERVAEELGSEVGGIVGYAVRFTDRVGDRTLVKVMTDGILLNDIQRDPLLLAYDTIIVDEAHERSLNIDFILGYLKRLLPRRADLKVIVTSATIDTERFSRHFGDAPVVEVSGRTYPVEVRYRPLTGGGTGRDFGSGDALAGAGTGGERDGGRRLEDRDQIQGICDAVAELCAEGPGDVLVFLSGEREIRDTADAVAALDLPAVEILPLYARLSIAEQHRVFQPHPGRRIVLATNVAETSLTVPGIRYVVDPGTARISRYSRRTKVQRLPIEPISRASADQRAGRCGRIGPGICIRLYGEDDFAARAEFTEPEILRTNLASVILRMAALGLGDVAAFPFVDPPDARNVKDGVALLEELGALDPGERHAGKRLTPLGRRLAQLPLDPRLGRMVLEAERHGCVREVMIIASALSVQDPRERPADQAQTAAELHARFADPDSDFLSFLNLWDYVAEEQRSRSSNQFRKLCKAEFLHHLRIREWQDIYSQLEEVTRGLGIRTNSEAGARDSIHRSLLAGLLSHIGMRDGVKQEYQGARNARFSIAPGSVLFKKSPRWVMAGELVETNRMWARSVARIEPEWAESLGAHLVKRTYSEPHWDARRGAASVYERVTLYGLPIVTARRVHYARVDRAGARQLFIRHALVEGDWESHHAFVEHNRKLVAEVRALEDRARRRDILVDEETFFDFYDERLGAGVASTRDFDRWWQQRRGQDRELLNFTIDMLIDPRAGAISASAYPDTWPVGGDEPGGQVRLSYEFEPGSEADGVTAHIPLPLVEQAPAAGFDWQVPGLREELVTELIRSLPKALRRSFVPAADHARAFLAGAAPGDGPLLETLARHLSGRSGERIRPDSFQLERVPDHLKMTFRVEDDSGRAVAAAKDLGLVVHASRARLRAAIAEAARAYERPGLQDWTVGTVPRTVEVEWAGHTVEAYPALADEGDSVALRVCTSRVEQERVMWGGVRRLLMLGLPSARRAAERRLPNETRIALARSPYGTAAELFEDAVACAVDSLMTDHGGPVWDPDSFRSLREAVGTGLVDTVVYVVTVAGGILATTNAIELRLDGLTAPPLRAAAADIRRQLDRLVHRGFIAEVGIGRLSDVLRYLEAIERRLDKLPQAPGRDAQLMGRIQHLEEEHRELLALLSPGRVRDREAVRWMIEELRVSFFAQSLGTAHPVSEQRIRRELDRIAHEASASQ